MLQEYQYIIDILVILLTISINIILAFKGARLISFIIINVVIIIVLGFIGINAFDFLGELFKIIGDIIGDLFDKLLGGFNLWDFIKGLFT